MSAVTGVVAAIGAIVGGTINAINYSNQVDDQISDYEDKLKQLLASYNAKQNTVKLNYEIAQTEANKQAARSDASSNLDETNASFNANAGIQSLGLQQQAEGLAWNQAQQDISGAKGNALSQQAASGTRTSSVNDAIEMEAAQNIMQLDMQKAQQRSADNMTLGQIFQDLNNAKFDIQANRTDASDLRKSYLEGGSQYRLKEDTLNTNKLAYEGAKNDYENQIESLETNKGWNTLAAFFGGASTGASVTYNAASMFNDIKSSDYNTSTKRKNVRGSSAFSNGSVYSNNSDYYKYGAHW